VSKTWYPTIDQEKCIGCNKCVSHCRHDVLAIEEENRVYVLKPENCLDSCWGCFTICRSKAIIMPKVKQKKSMGCNACGRTPCRFGSRGMSNVGRSLVNCQGMATIKMLEMLNK